MDNEQYILLLADIHANEAALRAVKQDAQRRYSKVAQFRIWFLGDLFGRGPAPIDTWFTLQSYQPEAGVVGNHDWGIIGRSSNVRVDGRWDGLYNPADWQVLLSHRQELLDSILLEENGAGEIVGGPVYEQLCAWPIVHEPHPGVYLIHGGLERPFTPPNDLTTFLPDLVWDYVRETHHARYTNQMAKWLYKKRPQTPEIVAYNAHLQKPRLIILGHWHYRRLYFGDTDLWEPAIQLGYSYSLPQGKGSPIILSPGSVGFSAEENDRDASYAVLCMRNNVIQSVTFYTAPYDRQTIRRQMFAKNYPEETIGRLRLPGEKDDWTS
jgi:hypothetical protein